VHVCIEKADLIINIGHDVVEKPPFFNVVHNQIGKNNFTAFKEASITGEMYCYIILNTHLSHFLL